jgi:tetratricopeptide (TPR) repeat protein
VRRFALLAAFGCSALLGQWTVAKSSHFEVYSQTGGETAQRAFFWFEQLRAFFQQESLLGGEFGDQGRPTLRVICLRETEYEKYRLRPTADSYYVLDGTREHIVMATPRSMSFEVAAHEYAHHVLQSRGLKLPPCLNEGLAEFYSTLRVNKGGYEVGGDLPVRMQTLRRTRWLPLAELLNFEPTTRESAAIFYAEGWALADMLVTSPPYAAHFREVVSELGRGVNAVEAFRKVYGKSLAEVAKDLEYWSGQSRSTRTILSRPAELAKPDIAVLSARQSNVLLAQVSTMSGHLDQARLQYEELLRDVPNDPDSRAALGAIALRQGKREEALRQWRQALSDNVQDAELCYRYALLAEEAGFGAHDVKAALERAVTLAPAFDDARYKLALLESDSGEYRSAVEQLRAMRVPTGARLYHYWCALASALTELDKRDEAQQAAQQAIKAAETEPDRLMARRLAYIAATDLKVRFATDSQGHSQVVTTRVQHGATDWNPFIEPSDDMRRADGKLAEVLCTAGKLTGFLLRAADGPVKVEVPDPFHVLMRNSANEFFCGRVQEKAVEADYAVVSEAGRTRNILRGMTFQ